SVAEPAPAYGAHTAAVADNPPGAGQYCPMGAPSADTPQGCPRPAPAGRRPDCTGGRHSRRRPEYLGPDPADPLAVSGRRRLAGTAQLTCSDITMTDTNTDTTWLDPIKRDAYGPIPAIAKDHDPGRVRMVARMNHEALQFTVQEIRALYWSRPCGKLG